MCGIDCGPGADSTWRLCGRGSPWWFLLCGTAARGSRRLTSVEHVHFLVDIHLGGLLHCTRSMCWLRSSQARHSWLLWWLLWWLLRLLSRLLPWLLPWLLSWLLPWLLSWWLIVLWRRCASLCSIQVCYVRKGSWLTACQPRADTRRARRSRRCKTHVTICCLAGTGLFAIICLTNRRLFSDTPQFLQGLRNRVKLLPWLWFLLLLLLLVWRGYVENIVTDVELEGGSRISWFWTGRGRTTLNSPSNRWSTGKALGGAGILLRGFARGRCPCVAIAIGRHKSCRSLDLVFALSPREWTAVEKASLLCKRLLFRPRRASFTDRRLCHWLTRGSGTTWCLNARERRRV